MDVPYNPESPLSIYSDSEADYHKQDDENKLNESESRHEKAKIIVRRYSKTSSEGKSYTFSSNAKFKPAFNIEANEDCSSSSEGVAANEKLQSPVQECDVIEHAKKSNETIGRKDDDTETPKSKKKKKHKDKVKIKASIKSEEKTKSSKTRVGSSQNQHNQQTDSDEEELKKKKNIEYRTKHLKSAKKEEDAKNYDRQHSKRSKYSDHKTENQEIKSSLTARKTDKISTSSASEKLAHSKDSENLDARFSKLDEKSKKAGKESKHRKASMEQDKESIMRRSSSKDSKKKRKRDRRSLSSDSSRERKRHKHKIKGSHKDKKERSSKHQHKQKSKKRSKSRSHDIISSDDGRKRIKKDIEPVKAREHRISQSDLVVRNTDVHDENKSRKHSDVNSYSKERHFVKDSKHHSKSKLKSTDESLKISSTKHFKSKKRKERHPSPRKKTHRREKSSTVKPSSPELEHNVRNTTTELSKLQPSTELSPLDEKGNQSEKDEEAMEFDNQVNSDTDSIFQSYDEGDMENDEANLDKNFNKEETIDIKGSIKLTSDKHNVNVGRISGSLQNASINDKMQSGSDQTETLVNKDSVDVDAKIEALDDIDSTDSSHGEFGTDVIGTDNTPKVIKSSNTMKLAELDKTQSEKEINTVEDEIIKSKERKPFKLFSKEQTEKLHEELAAVSERTADLGKEVLVTDETSEQSPDAAFEKANTSVADVDLPMEQQSSTENEIKSLSTGAEISKRESKDDLFDDIFNQDSEPTNENDGFANVVGNADTSPKLTSSSIHDPRMSADQMPLTHEKKIADAKHEQLSLSSKKDDGISKRKELCDDNSQSTSGNSKDGVSRQEFQCIPGLDINVGNSPNLDAADDGERETTKDILGASKIPLLFDDEGSPEKPKKATDDYFQYESDEGAKQPHTPTEENTLDVDKSQFDSYYHIDNESPYNPEDLNLMDMELSPSDQRGSPGNAVKEKVESRLKDPFSGFENPTWEKIIKAKAKHEVVRQQRKKHHVKKMAYEQQGKYSHRGKDKQRSMVDYLVRQSRVEQECKDVLKVYYKSKDITKEEYKTIMRKAVPQVTMSNRPIIPEKVRSLIKKFVSKCKGQRLLNPKTTVENTGKQTTSSFTQGLTLPGEQRFRYLNPNLPMPPV